MSGHGSGDFWINTDVPPGDPRRKTQVTKAEEGGQWEANRGRWDVGKQPNRDYNQRWSHYDRQEYAAEQSGGQWEYQQARGKSREEDEIGYGKWGRW